jgi:hypothetical protein
VLGIDLPHLGVIDILFSIEKVECCFLTELEFIVDPLGDKTNHYYLYQQT